MEAWLPRWRARAGDGAAQRLAQANPAVIPRNHQVEEALTAATAGDMAPFHALLAAIQQPFAEREALHAARPHRLWPLCHLSAAPDRLPRVNARRRDGAKASPPLPKAEGHEGVAAPPSA